MTNKLVTLYTSLPDLKIMYWAGAACKRRATNGTVEVPEEHVAIVLKAYPDDVRKSPYVTDSDKKPRRIAVEGVTDAE